MSLLREAADLPLSPFDEVPRGDVSVSVAEGDKTKK